MEILRKFEDTIFALERATSIISLIQTAVSEGHDALTDDDLAYALYEITLQQKDIARELRQVHTDIWEKSHKDS